MLVDLFVKIEKRFLQKKSAPVLLTYSIDLKELQVLAILGASGLGKSTLLRCLAGLENPDQGIIRFLSQTWFESSTKMNVSPQKRKIGYLSQEYGLFPHLTAIENIHYGLRMLCSKESRSRCDRLIEILNLAGLEHRYPSQLSGGQKQRVALARTVVTQPCLLLLDEPFSALDTVSRERLLPDFKSLLKEWQLPTLLVTHDRDDVLALAALEMSLDGA
jgi:molybdate transport system ATP-binding protein